MGVEKDGERRLQSRIVCDVRPKTQVVAAAKARPGQVGDDRLCRQLIVGGAGPDESQSLWRCIEKGHVGAVSGSDEAREADATADVHDPRVTSYSKTREVSRERSAPNPQMGPVRGLGYVVLA